MTVSVDKVLPQIALLQREIVDMITTRPVVAHDNVPYSVSIADMPLFVNLVGALTSNALDGSDEFGRDFIETRSYQMNLLHSAYATGVEGEKYGQLVPYFDKVYALFGKYPHLKGLDGVVESSIVVDSGVTTIDFIGQKYFGIRFTLRVIAKVRRMLDQSE